MRINWHLHPLARSASIAAIEERIFLTSIAHGALVMRGSWFAAELERRPDTMFFRATYAAAPFEQIDEAIRRFGVALREEFGIEEGESGEVCGNGIGNGIGV
jgi:aromatic amino acid aminotransferase I